MFTSSSTPPNAHGARMSHGVAKESSGANALDAELAHERVDARGEHVGHADARARIDEQAHQVRADVPDALDDDVPVAHRRLAVELGHGRPHRGTARRTR